MDDHQITELLENLEAWGEEFRTNQHGATLTILRARKTIADQAAMIAQLKVAGVELVETARRNLPRLHPTIERNAKIFIPENVKDLARRAVHSK